MKPNIVSEAEYDAVVNRMIALEQQPDAENNTELNELAAAVAAYDDENTPVPALPKTLRGILELEMFKRRLKQRQMAELLEVHETRLSEMLRGKRPISYEFAQKLFIRLHIPAETVLTLQEPQAA
jgi:HTH-type transcriptional regulator/antitoxin HigA